tara:strand:- start:497 stop:700 length:204 start_codon:yes stop_codon:yes gene_type:complete
VISKPTKKQTFASITTGNTNVSKRKTVNLHAGAGSKRIVGVIGKLIPTIVGKARLSLKLHPTPTFNV